MELKPWVSKSSYRQQRKDIKDFLVNSCLGLGCAMMKRITKINSTIQLLEQTGLPVSVKMRLGLNDYEKDNKTYLNLLKETNASYYIVHARHGRQTASDKPDWKVYRECLSVPNKTIVANGDIRTLEDLKLMLAEGLHGVMLGRVAVQNPSIFSQFKNYLETGMEPQPNTAEQAANSINNIKTEYLTLMEQYYASEEEKQPNLEAYKDNFLRHFANQKYSDLNFASG